ncbi:LexA family protein [Spirosoma linguale]|uniref:SOS-response transcriptional repressors (RecA-mediated autopeptidase)-like protein n=1 Tax=Spirosoma linguale (strain ATCC 33905 / DSM 74 / LMG 10896 / Claus 1) TaxID=504472 RepID=D2QCM1_SPILD|nr:SOS-response transcriptional repressors (RecA- mediated autopeptidase)-like protein [Spirosoma linguale DSM 74]
MIRIITHQHEPLPLLICKVSAGFPSPADDHLEGDLDLYDFLVKKPATTFLVRAKGQSMQGIGIYDGDVLVVDRSEKPLTVL